MCRFVLYQGPEISLASLLIDPEHSLIHQSYHAKERDEPLNGDGFGVAWFPPGEATTPVVFKEVSPAWNSINLRSIAPITRSHCILAHVRAASPGLGVSQFNCHPFAQRGLCFMHNGEVGDFFKIRRSLMGTLSDASFDMIRGTTDSELLFALVLDALPEAPTLNQLSSALEAVIHQVEDALGQIGSAAASTMNLCLSDGVRSVFTRYATPGQKHCQTLYCNQGERYSCIDGVCHMVEPGTVGHAVLVSSEPLSKDPGWEPVPLNHLLTIAADRTIARAPLASPRKL